MHIDRTKARAIEILAAFCRNWHFFYGFKYLFMWSSPGNWSIKIGNQASDKSVSETSPNLLFEIKKLTIVNPNKFTIESININSFPNKIEQLKDTIMQYIDIPELTETKFDDTFPSLNENGNFFIIDLESEF